MSTVQLNKILRYKCVSLNFDLAVQCLYIQKKIVHLGIISPTIPSAPQKADYRYVGIDSMDVKDIKEFG